MKPVAAALALQALLFPAIAQQQRSAAGVNFYSVEKENEIGAQTAGELDHALSLVHEPILQAYLTRLGAELARSGGAYAYRFAFYSGGSPSGALALAMPIDAFQRQTSEPVSVAGGTVFVSVGLLADAPNEGAIAFGLEAGARFMMGTLNFSRELELEADAEAVNILAAAGFDPDLVARYIESLPAPGSSGMSEMYSAHPAPAERVRTIREAIAKLPTRTYRAATGEFDALKALR